MDKELKRRLETAIDLELTKCSQGLYPTLCELRESKMGKEKIYQLVTHILTNDPMDIRSALAQVESSL